MIRLALWGPSTRSTLLVVSFSYPTLQSPSRGRQASATLLGPNPSPPVSLSQASAPSSGGSTSGLGLPCPQSTSYPPAHDRQKAPFPFLAPALPFILRHSRGWPLSAVNLCFPVSHITSEVPCVCCTRLTLAAGPAQVGSLPSPQVLRPSRAPAPSLAALGPGLFRPPQAPCLRLSTAAHAAKP